MTVGDRGIDPHILLLSSTLGVCTGISQCLAQLFFFSSLCFHIWYPLPSQLIFIYYNPCFVIHWLSTHLSDANKCHTSNIFCCLSHCPELILYFLAYTKLSKYEKNKPFDGVFIDSLSDAVCVLTCTLSIAKWWSYIICYCEGWWMSRISLIAWHKINTWITAVVTASFKKYLSTSFLIILSLPEPHKQSQYSNRKGWELI